MPRSSFARVAFGFAVAFIAAGFVGCGDPKMDLEWKMFGIEYHNYHDVYKEGPSGIADLQGSRDQFPRLAEQIENGDVLVRWNVKLFRDGSESDKYVLAHEADAAENGGRVLMGGASLKHVSAEEFKAMELFPLPESTPAGDAEAITVEQVEEVVVP